MVVAQFTGVSLQKDDSAFIKWDGSTYIAGNHTDGDSIYKPTYRNFHVKCSNDAVIQAVSVFAVGLRITSLLSTVVTNLLPTRTLTSVHVH